MIDIPVVGVNVGNVGMGVNVALIGVSYVLMHLVDMNNIDVRDIVIEIVMGYIGMRLIAVLVGMSHIAMLVSMSHIAVSGIRMCVFVNRHQISSSKSECVSRCKVSV